MTQVNCVFLGGIKDGLEMRLDDERTEINFPYFRHTSILDAAGYPPTVSTGRIRYRRVGLDDYGRMMFEPVRP